MPEGLTGELTDGNLTERRTDWRQTDGKDWLVHDGKTDGRTGLTDWLTEWLTDGETESWYMTAKLANWRNVKTDGKKSIGRELEDG